ncbi:MAG: gliding motility-associated C-terminal domain-containing protein [Filimonas sp.]|nr:gliding motility-associated C-terminal domain-containing protein [Filimonas sp.]
MKHCYSKRSPLLTLFLFLLICFCSSQALFGQVKRVYGSSQTSGTGGLGGTVTSPGSAADGNVQTAASINAALLGSAWVQIAFANDASRTATTPVRVKIGSGGSLLSLASGGTIQAYKSGAAVGTAQQLGGLVTLLDGADIYEAVFTPGVDYDAVRITRSATVNLGPGLDIYEAYYYSAATNVNCDAPLDVLYGVNSAGIASFIGSVTTPYNSIDGDPNTSATLNATVGLLAFTQETALFPGLSQTGDSIRILISTPAALLSANVISSLVVETFANGVSNGDASTNSGLISVRLLAGSTNKAYIAFKPTAQFDAVQIRLGGVASVLASVNVFEIERISAVPTFAAPGSNQSVCAGTAVSLTASSVPGATIRWYDASTSGNLLTTGVTYNTPALSNTTVYYAEGQKAGCTNVSYRAADTVTVIPLPVAATIAASGLAACSGRPTTLTVSNAQAGTTYNWYSAATGGTLLNTGTTFTTGNLNTNDTTFYVEAVTTGSTCLNTGGRTVATVTVGTTPVNVAVVPASQSISSGQQATMSIASTTPGATYNWYTVPTGGVAVGTGTPFTTPPLTTGTTYYGEASIGSCAATRVASVVNILTGTVTDVPCESATAQTNTVNGICIGCSVTNPSLAVDSDKSTGSSLNVFAGLLGGYAQQTLIFPTAGVAGDSIRVAVRFPSALVGLGALSSIEVATYNNATYNNDRTAINASLVKLDLLSNNQDAFLTIAATQPYDRIEVRVNSGAASLLQAVQINYAHRYKANATLAADTINICSGNIANIIITNPVAGVTYNWYDAPTGGNLVTSGTSYSNASLTDTTNYYIESVSSTGCAAPARKAAVVNVAALPANPTIAAAGLNACSTRPTTLTVSNAQAGVTYNWYNAVTGGTLLATGSSFTTGNLNTNDTTFYVQAVGQGSCLNPGGRTTATVTVGTTPLNVAVVPAAQTISSGQQATMIISSTTSGVVYNWYTVATGGASISTGASYTTVPLTTSATYYGEASIGSCAADRIASVVTVSTGSGVPVPCDAATTQTTDVNGICIGCGVSNPALAVDNDASTSSSISVFAGLLGGYAQQTLIFPAAGVAGDSVRISVRFPAALVGLGALSSIQVATYNGATYNNDRTNINSALVKLDLLSNNQDGFLTIAATQPYDRVEVRINSGAASLLQSMQINYANRYKANATLTADTTGICSGNTATINIANPQAGVTYNWYDAPTGGTLVYTGSSYTTGALTDTVNYYIQSVNTATGCAAPTRKTAVVNVAKIPANPTVAAAGLNGCSTMPTTLTVSNAQSNVTYNWYTAASGGTAVATGSSFTTGNLNTNDTTFYVEAVGAGNCINTGGRTVALVTVGTTPANVAVVPAAQTISPGQQATMTVSSTTSGAVYNWYTQPTGGSSVSSGATYTTPALGSSATYYGEASIGLCAAPRVASVVTVSTGSGSPVPCDMATSQTTDVNGICIGCGVTNPALAVDNDASTSSSISVFAGLLGGYAQQTLIFPTAGVAGDSIHISVRFPAALVGLGALSSIQVATYNGATYNNDRTNINSALVKLDLLSNNQDGFLTIPATQAYDRVEVRINSGAASLLQSMQINYANRYKPAATLTADTVSICSGNTANLSISNPVAGVTYNWYDAPTGGTLVNTGTSYTTGVLTDTVNYYIASVNTATGCATPGRKVAVVNVAAIPANPAIAASGLNACSTRPTTLTVSNAQAGVTYNWYTVASGGTPVFSGSSFTTGNLGTNDTTFYIVAVSGGSCTNAAGRIAVNVTVGTTPLNVAVVPAAQTISSGQSASMTINSTTSGAVYNWYLQPTGGGSVFTGATYTTPALSTTTTYYGEASVGACAATRIASVVNINSIPGGTVPCEAATSQTNDVGAICIGCSVNNPALAVDNDASTSSSINVFAGLLGGYAEQALIFPSAGAVGDSIRISVRFPAALVNLGVLSSVQVATYNGATYNNDRTAINSGLIKLNLLSNNQDGFIVIPATQVYDRVEVRVNSGAATLLQSLQINYAHRIKPTATLTADTVAICSGNTATITISNPVAGVTYNWYDAPAGGNLVTSGTSYTTGVLTDTTNYYIESVSAIGCAAPTRKTAVVNVAGVPVKPTVAAAGLAACAAKPTTLSVNNPVAGVTYNWYTAASGGTAVATGSSFTTGNLGTNDTTFYVEAVGAGTCINAGGRTAATVTVGATPSNVTVNPASQIIASGQTATMTVNSTTSGAVYNWYAQPTGGGSIFSGATYTTPALTNSVTYYGEASIGACASARIPSLVTVNTGGNNPVPCDPATSQTNTVNGICIGCAVTNPALAVDNDALSGSTVSVLAGLTGGYAQQTLIFPTTGVAGDSIRLSLRFPAALATVGVLSSVEVATYNGATYNNDRTAINSSLIKLNILSNNQDAFAVIPATQAYDRVEVRVNSGLATLLQSLQINYANRFKPTASLAADTVAICSGNTATLTITNPVAGTTYNWYDAPTGGTMVTSGTTYTTGALTDTTNYYIASVNTATGCESPVRKVAVVNVGAIPGAPVVGTGVTVCAGQPATLTVTNATAGVTYNWYSVVTGGTIAGTGTTFTTGALSHDTTFYVIAVAPGGCSNTGGRTSAAVTVASAPATPTVATTGLVVCAGQPTTLYVSNPQTGVTYNWYSVATGGTIAGTGSSFTTGNITKDTTFYVEAVGTGCTTPSARATAAVTLSAAPTPPTIASTGLVVCAGQPTTLSISNPQTGYTYNWYSVATGGTIAGTGTSFTTGNITKDTTFYAEAVAGGCATPSARTAAAVTLSAAPAAPTVAATGLTVCAGQPTTLSISNPQTGYTYNWYSVATGGTIAGTGVTFTTGAITKDTAFYVEALAGGCTTASTRTAAAVKLNTAPAAPTVAATGLTVCAGQPTTLTISNPQTGITYNWYNVATGGTPVGSGTTFTTGAISKDTTFYAEAVSTVNGCNTVSTTRTAATVTLSAAPITPIVASTGLTVCAGQPTTLTVSNVQTGYTYNWYSVATGGTAVGTGASFTTGAVTKDTTFYVEAVAGGCATASTRAAAAVKLSTAPAAPTVATTGLVVCAGQSTTLSVSNPQTGYTYNWYSVATGGTAVGTGTSFTTGAITKDTTFYVEAVAGGCATASARATAAVKLSTAPAAPTVAATGLTVCVGQPTTLSISNPQTGYTYNWYSVATGGTVVGTGTSFTTGTITKDTTFYVEAVAGGCATASIRTTAAVKTSTTDITPVIAGGGANTCAGQPATLTVANPQAGVTYNWYTQVTGGTSIFTGASFTTGALSKDTTFYVQATSTSGCTNAPARVAATVHINSTPAVPLVANNLTVCKGQSTTLAVASPQPGFIYNWYSVPTGGTAVFSGTSFTTPQLNTTTSYYLEVAGTCSSATRTQATIVVNDAPATPVVAAAGTTACAGQPTTVMVQNPLTGITYTWYTAASGGTQVGTGSSFTTPPVTANISYFVQADNGSCTAPARGQAAIQPVSNIPAPTIAASGLTICAGLTTTLSVSNPQTGYVYNWYTATTGGTLVNTGNTFTTGVLSNDTTYYVEAALATGCASASRTAATVKVNAAPAAPAVVTANLDVCRGTSFTLSVASPQAGITYRWFDAATGGNLLSSTKDYNGSNVAASGVFYVEAVNGSGCASAMRTPANVNLLPAPATPTTALSTPSICPGATVQITAQSAGATAFRWYATANGTTSIFTGNPFTSGSISTDTTFYVEAVSAAGCSSIARASATVAVNKPLAAPVVTVQNTTPTTVTFTWQAVTGATGYQVSLDTGKTFLTPSSGTTGLSQTVSNLKPGDKVSIVVRATGASSCQTSPLSAIVSATTINPLSDIYIPNAFTPNNDGKNDIFLVYGNSIASVEMYIFNQWGQLIFQSNDAGKGWDGTYSGKLQPVGVYVYIVKATLRDGTVINKKGSLNLIR